MRVRLTPRTDTAARRARGVVHGRAVAIAPAAPPPPAAPVTELLDERRVRAAGGPHDRAQYACSCGYVFDGDPTASWALVDIEDGEVRAEIRRTTFDVLSVANAISAPRVSAS